MRSRIILTGLAGVASLHTCLAMPSATHSIHAPVVDATIAAAPTDPPLPAFYLDRVEIEQDGSQFVWLDKPGDFKPGLYRVERSKLDGYSFKSRSGETIDDMFNAEENRLQMGHVDEMKAEVLDAHTPTPTHKPTSHSIIPVDVPWPWGDNQEEARTSNPYVLPTPTDQAGRDRRKWKGFRNIIFNDNDDGCENKTAANNHLFFHHKTFLDHDQELAESWLFYVDTPWKLTYPSVLRANLIDRGFEMVDAPRTCEHWFKLYSVSNSGVNRGSIEMKIPVGFANKKWSKYNDLWAMVEDAMEETYPSLEMAMIVIGSISAAVLVIFLVGLVAFKYSWSVKFPFRIGRKRRPTFRDVEDDCVELTGAKKKNCSCGAAEANEN